MKKLFALTLLLTVIATPMMAATPETVNEYFAGPIEGGLGTKFRAYALRTKSQDGVKWSIKLKMAFGLLTTTSALWFYLSIDEAKAMLAQCKHYLNSPEEAKQSKADVYEKRIGVIDKLDMVYRMDNIGHFEEFWFSPAGELASEKSLVLSKDEFNNLTKSLEGALAKVAANQ